MKEKEYQKVKVDKAKFKTIIAERGLVMSEVCRNCGLHPNHISNALYYGEFNNYVCVLLDRMYNIKREDYELKEEPEQLPEAIEPVKEAQTTIDYEELYKTIYGAVYEAVKKAWSE